MYNHLKLLLIEASATGTILANVYLAHIMYQALYIY